MLPLPSNPHVYTEYSPLLMGHVSPTVAPEVVNERELNGLLRNSQSILESYSVYHIVFII